jgi:hypothetical protein
LAIIGLTWGGVAYPWDSAHVLVPLILGLVLVGCFLLYEFKVPLEPTVPYDVLSNRTSLSGFLATAIHGITSISIICMLFSEYPRHESHSCPSDYLPVYFQACFGASPIRSGVDMLGTALIVAPFALVCGIMVQVMNRYIPANTIGWVLTIVGFGLLSMLKADASTGQWVGFQIVAAAGTGMIVSCLHIQMLVKCRN